MKLKSITPGLPQDITVRFRLVVTLFAVIAMMLVYFWSAATIREFWGVAYPYGSGMGIIFLIGLSVQFLWIRISERKRINHNSEWYKGYLQDTKFSHTIFCLFCLTLIVSLFTIYKSKVIGESNYEYDAMFILWDRLIFAGYDAWVLTHALTPSAEVTKFLDTLYHPTFYPMVLVFIICAIIKPKPGLRYTYMTSYLVSIVLVGMIAASLLHSAGPVFDGKVFGDGQTFGALIERLHLHDEQVGPLFSVHGQTYLFQAYSQEKTSIGGGISAMPSMHIIFVFLWVFAAFHLHKALGVLITVYGMAIWYGSVHLGWHYFVDGLVALIMLAIIWYISGRIYGLYGNPQVTRATT